MTTFIQHPGGDAPRSQPSTEARPRTAPRRRVTRWAAAALFTFGLGLGVAPQIAQAQPGHAAAVPAPPDSVPATSTEVTVVTPAPCTVQIVVDAQNPAPSTTLPGSCTLSAAHGEFPRVAGANGEVSDLPVTGSSMGPAAAIAAFVLAAGAALWFVARRPRAS